MSNETLVVRPEDFVRAETDRYFSRIVDQAGGVNRLFHFRQVTPLDRQTIVRMNRDTLYSMGVADTTGGATVTFPELPDDRYASIYLTDNDHYVPFVIYEPGVHRLPTDTPYLGIGVRIQVFDPDDPAELALVNALQDRFVIGATNAEPFVPPPWDQASLTTLRDRYEAEFSTFDRYPDGWQGPRGQVDERTRHLAAAGAWGLFPNRDATYINYTPPPMPGDCFTATYDAPENDAFWSITVYGRDGYIKDERSIVNSSTVVPDADGRFSVHFGACDQADVTNRLDITDGWNFLMRIYRPGPTVLDGTYRLPEVRPAD